VCNIKGMGSRQNIAKKNWMRCNKIEFASSSRKVIILIKKYHEKYN